MFDWLKKEVVVGGNTPTEELLQEVAKAKGVRSLLLHHSTYDNKWHCVVYFEDREMRGKKHNHMRAAADEAQNISKALGSILS